MSSGKKEQESRSNYGNRNNQDSNRGNNRSKDDLHSEHAQESNQFKQQNPEPDNLGGVESAPKADKLKDYNSGQTEEKAAIESEKRSRTKSEVD